MSKADLATIHLTFCAPFTVNKNSTKESTTITKVGSEVQRQAARTRTLKGSWKR
jgi:hypothetical protein